MAELLTELQGKTVGGWCVRGNLGAGKSAVVFHATRGEEEGALKVFFPELIQRAGKENQLKRIQRELALGKHGNPNLIEILDGGECPTTGYLYVVMQKVDAPNLGEVLKDVPREAIRPIIAQVADAARFLETLSPPIAHRDIKPENIAISRDFKKATLLDLGVILPIDLNDAVPSSDGERRFFVGTLRYSPPEFLIRNEEYSLDGWRAVTFYQLGAVLYDLMMRERIFEEFAEPYTRLVMAVQHEIPRITAQDVPEELRLVAANCLNKEPSLRLRYVNWEDFSTPEYPSGSALAAKERVRRRLALEYGRASEAERSRREQARAMLRAMQDVQSKLHAIIKAAWGASDMFGPIECREHPGSDSSRGYVALRIPPSDRLMLKTSMWVWFRITVVDEKALAVDVDYAACLSNIAPLAQLVDEHSRRVFGGVFVEGVVQAAVMDLLYRLLDIAQLGAGTSDPAGCFWLEATGE